jgi:hypothetical protein
VNTCLGSAATTATPSLDPAASRMLDQYLACVAACDWGKVVFETRTGLEHFDFSCRTSNSTPDEARPPWSESPGQVTLCHPAGGG